MPDSSRCGNASPACRCQAGVLISMPPLPWRLIYACLTWIAVRPATDGSGTLTLFASLANYGTEPAATSVTVVGDGLEIGRGETTLMAGGEPVSLQWVLPPGVGEINVRI